MTNEDWVTGNITISLGGEPLELRMTVPARAVKPRRMLPIFQQMTNSFVGMTEQAIENVGDKISCRAGCGACCRQAVPIAEIEAHDIAETVENLPEPRRSAVKLRFEKAWRHFAEIGWLKRLDNCVNLTREERERVFLDYFHERIACPFLENEGCSIHEARPLACREYLVTSPAENCSNPTAESVEMVKLPIKPAGIVRQITNSENLNRIINFVPLVLALEWVKHYPDNFPEKTGQQWMADFFTNLTKSEIPENDKE